MIGSNYAGIIRARYNSLDFIAKLTNIAGPIADHQQVYSWRRDLNVPAAKLRRIVVDVIVDDGRDFRAALA